MKTATEKEKILKEVGNFSHSNCKFTFLNGKVIVWMGDEEYSAFLSRCMNEITK